MFVSGAVTFAWMRETHPELGECGRAGAGAELPSLADNDGEG